MALLHGTWIPKKQTQGYLFIWGEVWHRFEPLVAHQIHPYPFTMAGDELINWLDHSLNLGAVPTQFTSQLLSLPSIIEKDTLQPQHSTHPTGDYSLYPWQISGLVLQPAEAILFLNRLPLSPLNGETTWLGDDLRFWIHMGRWCLDLLSRGQFLPTLDTDSSPNGAAAHWQPFLNGTTDLARLQQFERQMPMVCRMYAPFPHSDPVVMPPPPSASFMPSINFEAITVTIPPPTVDILRSFLSSMVDSMVRQVGKTQTFPKASGISRQWLQALGGENGEFTADALSLSRLKTTLSNWATPLSDELGVINQFRVGFKLHPPTHHSGQWSLEYGLQSIHDPGFWVDAATVWRHPVDEFMYQGQTLHQPQETLLKGLGLAAKFFNAAHNPIDHSLEEPFPTHTWLTPHQVYELIQSTAKRLQENGLGVILPPGLATGEGRSNRLGLSIEVAPFTQRPSPDLGLHHLLQFHWQLSIGGHTVTRDEFEQFASLNIPLVNIRGDWVELRSQDIRAARDFFNRKEPTKLTLEDALRISTGESPTLGKLPIVTFSATGSLQQLVTTLTGSQGVEPIETPLGFCGDLRPYQAKGVGWLLFLNHWGLGACLADDMGLGKTIQLIAFLVYLQTHNQLNRPFLLICPTSVLGNWQREVKKFAPQLVTLVHHGDKRSRGELLTGMGKTVNLVITSYALAYRDCDTLQGINWQGVVLDEAQNIKNADSMQAQAVRKITLGGQGDPTPPSSSVHQPGGDCAIRCRIALTGTPLENRLTELWSIMDFLNPGYLGSRNFFQRRFAIPIERYGDTASLKTLRSLIQPFILRRLKSDRQIIQDLPNKQEIPIFCGLTTEQATLYQSIVHSTLVEIESTHGIQRRGLILGLLVKLKQVCNHPALFHKESLPFLSTTHLQFLSRSTKLQRLVEMLAELLSQTQGIQGDRALIFTQFAEWGKQLKPLLELYLKQEVLLLYGGVTKKQREAMIDRFQHDPQGPRIFILSLKAGGVGLNLTRANHVFHYDRWWNPAVENQATDRAFRIGQTRNVQVHKFVCSGTLEEKIHDLIASKQSLAEQVVGVGESWLTELNTDQLKDLLLLDRNAVIEAD